MCMKNINATLNMFASVNRNGDYVSFSVPFDTIRCIIKDNIAYISDFFIVANLNLMGTTKPEFKKDNIVENKKKLCCLIRLTKISQNEEERISWDVERFEVDSSDKAIRFDDACVPCVNYRKTIEVKDIEMTDEYRGDYALKLLVRADESEKWQVQSITRLTVI